MEGAPSLNHFHPSLSYEVPNFSRSFKSLLDIQRGKQKKKKKREKRMVS
jgi:hypothetical protein